MIRRSTVARGLTLGLLAGLVACGPPSVWTGLSPDHRTRYEVAQRDGRSCIVIGDGREQCFAGISVRDVTFSADSRHLAFPALEGGTWRLVVDGTPGPPLDGIGSVVFSPDGSHLAYAALRDGSWHVVRDGIFGAPHDLIYDGSLQFDPTGQRLAYVSDRNGAATITVDERAIATHAGVGAVRFGANGARLGYVARDGGRAHLIVDGRTAASHDQILDFRFSPSGDDVAYLAQEADGVWVHAQGQSIGPFAHVSRLDYPSDRDGAAYVVRQQGRERVVFGASNSPWFASVEAPSFATHGTRWGYVGHDSTTSLVTIEGVGQSAETWATNLVLSGKGDRYAYLAQRANLTYVVHDEGERGFDLVVPRTLLFLGPEGRWACLAGDVDREELFVAVEGIERTREFDWSEAGRLIVESVAGGSVPEAEESLRSWVAAEARLLLDDGRRGPSGGGSRTETDAGAGRLR